MIPTPMAVSTTAGWQQRPHLVEFAGIPMIEFRFGGKLYRIDARWAAGLSDDEIAARFARPAEHVASELIRGAL